MNLLLAVCWISVASLKSVGVGPEIPCVDTEDPVLVTKHLDSNWDGEGHATRSCTVLAIEGECSATDFPLSSVVCPKSCFSCKANSERHRQAAMIAANTHIPQRFVINLDEPEENRYNEMIDHFAKPMLAVMHILRQPSNWNNYPVKDFLAQIIPSDFQPELEKELRGMAVHLDKLNTKLYGKTGAAPLTWEDVLLLNLYIELMAGSEGVGMITRDKNQKIYHAFNFDWPHNTNPLMDTALQTLICEREYTLKGKSIILAIGFAGEVGVSRGIRLDTKREHYKGPWSAEINHRRLVLFPDTVHTLTRLANSTHTSLSLFMRELMQKGVDYNSAVAALEQYKATSHAYILLSGNLDGEAGLITLAGHGAKVQMDRIPVHGWYLVQSNDDPITVDESEARNESAVFFLKQTVTQDEVSSKSLLKLLSTSPVMNVLTRFTTILCPSVGTMTTNLISLYERPDIVKKREQELTQLSKSEQAGSGNAGTIIIVTLSILAGVAALGMGAILFVQHTSESDAEGANSASWKSFIDMTRSGKQGYEAIDKDSDKDSFSSMFGDFFGSSSESTSAVEPTGSLDGPSDMASQNDEARKSTIRDSALSADNDDQGGDLSI